MYRSKFEERIAKKFTDLGIQFNYEGSKLKYIVPETVKNYIPDWDIGSIFYESKGRFTSADRRKMVLVKMHNPDKTIRIIFQNADVKLRKGSPTSYGQWATKNGFEWCDWRKGIPRHWLKEMKND